MRAANDNNRTIWGSSRTRWALALAALGLIGGFFIGHWGMIALYGLPH